MNSSVADLDIVMARDRAWFRANPHRRWRVRPIDPIECEMPGQAGRVIFIGLGRWVLVIAAPSRRWRIRHFFHDAALLSAPVSAIWAPAADLVRATTDDEFTRILRQNVRPIDGAAGAALRARDGTA